MSYATPILYLNMGGEMLYVLQQRLNTQRISLDKTIQVMNEVIRAFLNQKQLRSIFDKSLQMHLYSLRTILEQVVLSSIMKLDSNSMNKLFDLMITMVKYQLDTATGPREVILLTLNHLDGVRDMVVDKTLHVHIDLAYQLILSTFGNMSYKEIWQVRNDCLGVFDDCNTRVSLLLKLELQNQDGTFNRMIQKYNEQYMEQQEILEDIRLLADKSSMGSLLLIGSRVTLLGKNLYSSTFGQIHSDSSTQNSHKAVTITNKALKKEIETLAIQLGKEETISHRPISLHLFTNDERNIECKSKALKFNDFSSISDATDVTNMATEKEHLNDVNQSFDDYRRKLMDNINSEFSDNEGADREAIDLVNMLDIS
ncbi:PREDICTED: protein OSCP1 [Ceratosolen solmsi marchali]|uniref:Protein OSCP1 n=1 Tax=Ceratosolen solmsi marchali TaxID=326594 RepID=A0AAJ7DYU6_9HYME|nr:PREDICTED: protein OSCP1 [Ceratosolen solmsi marchali]